MTPCQTCQKERPDLSNISLGIASWCAHAIVRHVLSPRPVSPLPLTSTQSSKTSR